MSRKSVVRALVNWVASFFSITLLLSMTAGPALAYIAANQVVSSSIKDGSILNRDIRANVISSSRVKNNTILNRDIRANVISSSRIKNNTILNRDIAANVISSSRIRNRTILNHDISPNAMIAESKIQYSAKKGYLSLPTSAFRPASSDTSFTSLGLALGATGTGDAYFEAPVLLPNGAKVTKVTYFFRDNSAGYDTELKVYSVTGITLTEMAEVLSSGASTAPRQGSDTSISNSTVNNAANHHFALIKLRGLGEADIHAIRVLIEYTHPHPAH